MRAITKPINGPRTFCEDGERSIHESPSTGREERNKETAMDSKKTNQCRDYTILFYDEKSSTDLAKGLNEAKKAEAKLEKVHWREGVEGEAGKSLIVMMPRR